MHPACCRRGRALICGADGGIVTELRAFAAWLTVFSSEFRKRQIEDDPLGILLYGDAKNFSTVEKEWILSTIKSKGDLSLNFNLHGCRAQTFEVLATPGMATEFERILRLTPNTHGDQLIAACVTEALYVGNVIPGIGSLLIPVVREPRWWGPSSPTTRRSAAIQAA